MRSAQKKKSASEDDFPKIRHEKNLTERHLKQEDIDELLDYMSEADTKRWKL